MQLSVFFTGLRPPLLGVVTHRLRKVALGDTSAPGGAWLVTRHGDRDKACCFLPARDWFIFLIAERPTELTRTFSEVDYCL